MRPDIGPSGLRNQARTRSARSGKAAPRAWPWRPTLRLLIDPSNSTTTRPTRRGRHPIRSRWIAEPRRAFASRRRTRSLDRHQLGLELHDEAGPLVGAARQNVDRSALAVLRVGHLNGYSPAQSAEPLRRAVRDGRVPLVEQSIEGGAVPSQLERQSCIEHPGNRTHCVEGVAAGVPRFDSRPGALADACFGRNVRLAPAGPATQEANRSPELPIVHPRSMATKHPPARIYRSRGRTCALSGPSEGSPPPGHLPRRRPAGPGRSS